jgi:hypothetical protein
MTKLPQHEPKPRYFLERIGDVEYRLEETKLDVFDEVTLWDGNPRLLPWIAEKQPESEDDLEAYVQRSPGYEGLRKSLADVGQLEHIYVWKADNAPKYIALEGSTRVTVLRELSRKDPGDSRYRLVKAKVLPAEFPDEHRVILLARIHVRGSGVRSWGRYIEAKFIYMNTTPQNGQRALMTVTDMARWMGKSVSWVSRLRDAFEFANEYVEHLDSEDAHGRTVEHFSILEEIIKSSGFGWRLKDGTPDADKLRAEVFDMVAHDVFKEYRDARFMKEYFEDPEKWSRLKSHEKHIANELAHELKATGPSSLKGRIAALPAQIERTLDKDPEALDADDLTELKRCASLLASRVAGDVGPFRLYLQDFIKALFNVSLDDVKKVTPEEYQQLRDGLDDFVARLKKYASWSVE